MSRRSKRAGWYFESFLKERDPAERIKNLVEDYNYYKYKPEEDIPDYIKNGIQDMVADIKDSTSVDNLGKRFTDLIDSLPNNKAAVYAIATIIGHFHSPEIILRSAKFITSTNDVEVIDSSIGISNFSQYATAYGVPLPDAPVSEYRRSIESERSLIRLRLPGITLVVVDVSGSMYKHKATALKLLNLFNLQSELSIVYATGSGTCVVKPLDVELSESKLYYSHDIARSCVGSNGIFLVRCINHILSENSKRFDRVVIITDEEDCDNEEKAHLSKRIGYNNYLLNVSMAVAPEDMITAGWTRIPGNTRNVVGIIVNNERKIREKVFHV